MNLESLRVAMNVIEEVDDSLNRLSEEEAAVAAARLRLRKLNTYLVQLAYHLQNGLELDGALLKIVRGDTELMGTKTGA